MPLTPKELVKILKQKGFKEVRQSGSHLVMKDDTGKTVVVPLHCKDLKKGLEQAILKQVGLK